MNTDVSKANRLNDGVVQEVLRQFRVKSLCENEIHNNKGEKLGKLIDLIVAHPSGDVSFAVMSTGGFLGIGERLLMIPWNKLKLNIKKRNFTLSLTLEQLKKAPSFNDSNWPNLHNDAWAKHVLRYYGEVSIKSK